MSNMDPVEFGKAIGALIREELKTVKARLDRIESKGIQYRGVYQAAQDYSRGDLATHDGSMWHANVATRSAPGQNNDWTLAVKKGRDGR